jgi:hypothetical protein
MELNKKLLHELFEYRDGKIYWKVYKAKNRIKPGGKAGYFNSRGYGQIAIDGKKYGIHRIIFMMFNGCMPNEIDHIDGNPSNNLIENLREATHQQNQYNLKINKRNTSGIKGVYFDKQRNQWVVRFNIEKKSKYFGRFFNKKVARFVAETMRHKYHGNFANN